jgi:serine/threonine protein kinase
MPRCPQCGDLLPPDAPDGLCPKCVMVMNLKTETAFSGETSAAHPPLPPEQIAPHFPQLEILECLGRGGMGVVYKARQKTLNRFVALKLLAPERVQDAKFAERFAREAQALAALNHPNIVTIHDFGQAGGFYFFLMEFVDGLNLRQLLRARKFTPEEALAIVPPLCDALQFAHDRGIIHRDIKPENLLLDKTGRVKVADFGIAKMLGTANDSNGGGTAAPENSTQTVGTPSYSAPEQKTDPQHVDNRADIYSMGVVFYEMLTGELPCEKIVPPSTKVQIDVRLDEIVLRALEKKPELRYQQVSEVKTCVETIVRSATAPSTGTAEKRGTRAFLRFFKSKMAIAIGFAVVLAATAIIVVKATFFPAPPDSYFLPNYRHFQRLPSGLFILRPTHFSTPMDGLDYSCETDSLSGDHVTWNMGRNRSFAQLLCRIYNCRINQVVLPPGALSERFDYLYTLRDPNELRHFEAAIKKLGYTAHWEDQPARMLVVEKVAASMPSPDTVSDSTDDGRLVIDTEHFDIYHPQPGEMDWGFKCFIPPDHLASFFFVRWTNGVPVVDTGYSTYFKVGKASGIDIFCSLSCYRIASESDFSKLTDAERRQRLAAWNYPESAGITNAVRWNVNLGAGFTASSWIAMPPFTRDEIKLPQSVQSGHQRVIRLGEFAGPDSGGNHGSYRVELRIFLQPLKSPPIRVVPNEVDRTNYISGSGLAGTMEDAVTKMKSFPVDP